MKKEIRVIDGVLKVVEVVDGKIVKIIKDYKKPIKKEVRIIDGVLKVVEVVDGKIVKIVKDHKKPTIDEYKRGKYIKDDMKKRKIKREQIRCEQETYECREIMHKIEEGEIVHEIHHGKRHKYQREEIVKRPDKYRMKLLKDKADLGIIDKNLLNIKSGKKLLNDWARERGFNSYEEYLNIIALGRGFTCYREYEQVWMYYPEMPSPIKENRTDPRFIGIYIAENGIAKIYEGSQRMPYCNPGYDIICPKGYKIDVKSTVLNRYNTLNFRINQNMITDYFALIAFNNIIELKPMYMWLIQGDEDVYGCPIRTLDTLTILNEPTHLYRYKKYEKTDKLEKLRDICKGFDAQNKVEINDYNVPTKSMILDIILQLRMASYDEILPTDILHVLEKKKKETISDRVKIFSSEDMMN